MSRDNISKEIALLSKLNFGYTFLSGGTLRSWAWLCDDGSQAAQSQLPPPWAAVASDRGYCHRWDPKGFPKCCSLIPESAQATLQGAVFRKFTDTAPNKSKCGKGVKTFLLLKMEFVFSILLSGFVSLIAVLIFCDWRCLHSFLWKTLGGCWRTGRIRIPRYNESDAWLSDHDFHTCSFKTGWNPIPLTKRNPPFRRQPAGHVSRRWAPTFFFDPFISLS